jgi:hypothetical protein
MKRSRTSDDNQRTTKSKSTSKPVIHKWKLKNYSLVMLLPGQSVAIGAKFECMMVKGNASVGGYTLLKTRNEGFKAGSGVAGLGSEGDMANTNNIDGNGNGQVMHDQIDDGWIRVFSSKALGYTLPIVFEEDGILRSDLNSEIQELVDRCLNDIVANPTCCLIALRPFSSHLVDLEPLMPVLSGCFSSKDGLHDEVYLDLHTDWFEY